MSFSFLLRSIRRPLLRPTCSCISWCCIQHTRLKLQNFSSLMNECQKIVTQKHFGCKYANNYSTEKKRELTANEYEDIAEETLHCLSDKFDEISDTFPCSAQYDVTYSSGVLSVHISPQWGTYVINKQSPNKQIWLSSPVSGPKRYDYFDGKWIYSHDGVSLTELLSKEVSEAIGNSVDFSDCEPHIEK